MGVRRDMNAKGREVIDTIKPFFKPVAQRVINKTQRAPRTRKADRYRPRDRDSDDDTITTHRRQGRCEEHSRSRWHLSTYTKRHIEREYIDDRLPKFGAYSKHEPLKILPHWFETLELARKLLKIGIALGKQSYPHQFKNHGYEQIKPGKLRIVFTGDGELANVVCHDDTVEHGFRLIK
ncbi:hypothetical protein LTR64_002065 [Lithohypha guttulata]|uniref:uncharacterized protein n=1 Tax=Lithohypha guttulata TaxID=1690604 RepID=UPI00315DF645